jgi:prepilin-type N-terminal cleavage/methylation domain-containing protein
MKNGFTLIEMSIVLVIIGIIAAGVSGASSLIEAAKLRSVMSDVNRFKLAIDEYQLKYQALPGDHSEASKFFVTENIIYDGNGDGIITNSTTSQEFAKLWNHLTLAGLLEDGANVNKYFKGTARGGVSAAINPPCKSNYFFSNTTKFSEAFYGGHIIQGIKAKYSFQFGCTYDAALIYSGASPIISPINSEIIDIKSDDGLPYSGGIRATIGNSNSGETLSQCVDNTNHYLISNEEAVCNMLFEYR